MRAVILDRGSVAQRTAIADASLRQRGPVALVCNYEAAGMYPLADWILSQRWDCAILDESHLSGVKNPDTRTSQFAARLTPITGHRLTLSGTFLAQQPLDAYGQFRFIDPTIFGDDYAAFLDRYAAPKQLRLRTKLRRSHNDLMSAVAELYGTDSPLLDDIGEPTDTTAWLPGIKNAAQFAAKIDPITWRCRSEDVLDLPPLLTEYREIDLAPEQRRVYHQIEHELYGQIGAGVPVNSVLTYMVRLQQTTSGFVNDQAGHCCRFSQNPKRDALYDLLREADETSVVFCRYVADLDTVQEVAQQLGLRYAEISGRRKDALTDLATLRPGLDVVGVQPQSGGVGIDLTGAKIGVWYSLARSLPEYDQAVKRLHRPGTTGVRLYSLVAKNTVDAEIHSAISDRRDVIEGMLRRLRQNTPLPALQSKVPCWYRRRFAMSTEWKREMAQPKPQGLVAVVLPLPHGELRIEPTGARWVIWPQFPDGPTNRVGLWCEGDLDIVMREAPAAVKAALDLLSADLADYIAAQNQEAVPCE
jgi:hypothetical protein